MKLLRLGLMAVLAFFQVAMAEPQASQSLPKEKIQELVKQYYADKAVEEMQNRTKAFSLPGAFGLQHQGRGECRDRPAPGSCIDSACSHMPSYECDSTSDIRRVGEICRSADGECVDAVCSTLPSYECDSLSDLRDVARLCGNSNGECIRNVCNTLPSYECDSQSDLRGVAGMCEGVRDGGCVKAICARLPSYECDSQSDLKRIVKECKGF